jgi:hypothetical protein
MDTRMTETECKIWHKANPVIAPQIMPRTLPSTSIPIHYSQLIHTEILERRQIHSNEKKEKLQPHTSAFAKFSNILMPVSF